VEGIGVLCLKVLPGDFLPLIPIQRWEDRIPFNKSLYLGQVKPIDKGHHRFINLRPSDDHHLCGTGDFGAGLGDGQCLVNIMGHLDPIRFPAPIPGDHNVIPSRQRLADRLIGLRPMTTGLPMVTCLKNLRSPGMYQGNLLLRPITRLVAMATTTVTFMARPSSLVSSIGCPHYPQLALRIRAGLDHNPEITKAGVPALFVFQSQNPTYTATGALIWGQVSYSRNSKTSNL